MVVILDPCVLVLWPHITHGKSIGSRGKGCWLVSAVVSVLRLRNSVGVEKKHKRNPLCLKLKVDLLVGKESVDLDLVHSSPAWQTYFRPVEYKKWNIWIRGYDNDFIAECLPKWPFPSAHLTKIVCMWLSQKCWQKASHLLMLVNQQVISKQSKYRNINIPLDLVEVRWALLGSRIMFLHSFLFFL